VYNQLVNEKQEVLKTGKRDDMLILATYDNNTVPVINYSQNETLDGLLEITARLRHIKRMQILELQRFTNLLFTRANIFFCESNNEEVFDCPGMREATEDDPTQFNPNNDFILYCTHYFRVIFLHFYHYKIMKPMLSSELDDAIRGHKVEKIFRTDVCKFLGKQSISDIYQLVCEETYNFPGDSDWFKIRNPNMYGTLGQVLRTVRSSYYQSYYTEQQLSTESIIARISEEDTHQALVGRTFVLYAFDRYFASRLNCKNWRSCVFIPTEKLGGEIAESKISCQKMPLFLCLFGRPWVYDKKQLFAYDNVFDSIAAWAFLLASRYNSKLLDYDFTPFIHKIFDK